MDEREEGSSSVMLSHITGEGKRQEKDQEQKLLGENKVSSWEKLVTEPCHLVLEVSKVWRKNDNKAA